MLGLSFFVFAARLNVAFEEGSLVLAQKKLQRTLRIRHRRSGRWVAIRRFPPLFRLRPTAPPEVAIVWKNLIAAMRIGSPWLLVIGGVFGCIVAQALMTKMPEVRALSATMGLMLCAIFPLMGTRIFSQDLRLDLPRIEILKSYPISGERLVGAEIAAPLTLIAMVEILLLGGTSLMLHLLEKPGPFAFFASPQFIVVALLFAIPICAAQLVIHNAVPILLPAWAVRSKEEPRGFAVLGQRLVLLFGNLVVLAVGLIPAATLFLPALWFAHRLFGGSPIVLALGTVPAVALLALEVWIGIRFLGAQFDRIDVSSELDTIPL